MYKISIKYQLIFMNKILNQLFVFCITVQIYGTAAQIPRSIYAILAFFSKRALFLASSAPALISPAFVSAILVSCGPASS